MAECVTTPTLTTSVELVTESVLTTTFTSESYFPTSTVTSTLIGTLCDFDQELEETVCLPYTSTTLRTIPGGNTTVFITETTTIPSTIFVPTTLFGTSCPPRVTPSDDPPPVTPPSSTPTSSSYSTGSSSSISRTSSSSSASSLTSSSLPSESSATQTGGTNIAPIVGGAVGGAVALVGIGVMAYFFLKKAAFAKKAKFDDIFDKDHSHVEKPAINLGYQAGQEAFQNGGQYSNPPPPDSSATQGQQGYQGQPCQEGYQTGYQPGDPTGGLQQTLNGGEYQPQGGEYEGPDVDDIKRKQLRRLFTGKDDEELQQTPPQMPQNYMPPPRPLSNGGVSSVAPFVVNQVYPPQQPQYSNLSVSGHQPHHAQIMQQGYYPPSNLSHSPSAVSSGAASSQYSSNYGTQYGMPQQPMAPPPTSYSGAAQTHGRDQSVSSYGRSGSPVSIQNPQVLQVMNPEISYNPGSSSASGSGSGNPATSSSTSPYPVDGKGRPVNTMSEKAPIVHLDGGRYEEPTASLSGTTHPSSDPPPPAYT